MLKKAAIGFLVVLGIYLVLFYGIEHSRMRKGPWEVEFQAEGGVPVLVIRQGHLGVEEARLSFPGGKLPEGFAPSREIFDRPMEVPFETGFAKVFYEDLTFLPGVVTLHVYGHELEMLPRTFFVDRKEHPWQARMDFTLEAVPEKLPETADEP